MEILQKIIDKIEDLQHLSVDINNYLDHSQMLQIFGSIIHPGCALSVLHFFPPHLLRPHRQVERETTKITIVIDIIIIITAILVLIIPGTCLVSQGSQISFVFVKVRYQVSKLKDSDLFI